ncbi:hypothetical protein B0H19DRAFT_1068335 [Mycena capillaripes]|nr:hypothetical protein B0H19DRAFT_1068335 [Mycena capillaripes]
MLGIVSLALITKPSRAYSQFTVDCEPPRNPPTIDCSQFFATFCGSISHELVPPGEDIPTDRLGCLEDQSLGASCNLFATNDATTPQAPSKKICFEALTAINNTCIGSYGFAQAKGDGFRYSTEPLPYVCSQLTVHCEPSGQPPKIDCSQFFPAFCGSIGDELVPPGEEIPTDLGCLEDQSLGASCNIGGGNGAATSQVPSEKICLEVLTAINNTCIGSVGFAQAKGDSFGYRTQPLPFVCRTRTKGWDSGNSFSKARSWIRDWTGSGPVRSIPTNPSFVRQSVFYCSLTINSSSGVTRDPKFHFVNSSMALGVCDSQKKFVKWQMLSAAVYPAPSSVSRQKHGGYQQSKQTWHLLFPFGHRHFPNRISIPFEKRSGPTKALARGDGVGHAVLPSIRQRHSPPGMPGTWCWVYSFTGFTHDVPIAKPIQFFTIGTSDRDTGMCTCIKNALKACSVDAHALTSSH